MSNTEQNQEQTPERYFGLQLREYLDRKGIKYTACAVAAGFDKARMDRIFKGSEPSLEEARGLSRFLEVPIERLHDLDHFSHSQSAQAA